MATVSVLPTLTAEQAARTASLIEKKQNLEYGAMMILQDLHKHGLKKMTKIHATRDKLPKFIANAFGYTGNKFQVLPVNQVTLDNNYWEGGSKTDYLGINLATGEQFPPVGEFGLPFTNPKVPTVTLEPGLAIVAHVRFQGNDLGLRVYVHPDNLSGFIPERVELTDNECKVLYYTRSLKSSYGGVKNYRQQQSGLTPQAWGEAKVSCINRGLLNKAGAITTDGRNAIGDYRPNETPTSLIGH